LWLFDDGIFYGGKANEVISDNGYFLSKGWSAEAGQPTLSTNKWRLLGNANSTFINLTFTHFAGCESAAKTYTNSKD